uniref:Uncharacterized protein n=1 Tax=Caenorhabditis japonica TaxID=281687 RepID=A0A8R1E4X7_CAEJA
MHTAINCNGKSLSSSASPTVDAQPEPPSLPMPPPTLAAFTRTMPNRHLCHLCRLRMSPHTSSLYRPTIFGPRSRANQLDHRLRLQSLCDLSPAVSLRNVPERPAHAYKRQLI